MRLRFEGFELDTERRTLVGAGAGVDAGAGEAPGAGDDGDGRSMEIEVEPRVFDVMAYLAEHDDRVVPKEELLDELWGDRFVSESALSSAVKSVRRVLGDNGTEQRIVRTTYGRGYRMVVPVERIEHRVELADGADEDAAEDAAGPAGAADPNRPSRRESARPIPRPAHLLGRDAELDRVRALNEPRAAVTIVGPGGVGKTSLAVVLAHELAAADGHEVWFCGLGSQSSADVASEVLNVIDNTAGSSQATVDRIAERLGSGRVTLILDNCEHLLDPVRALIVGLLDRLPDLSVVATSRELIGVAGERLVRLGGLRGGDPDSPAVQLFLRRGGELGAVVDDAESRSIAVRITERLDGLPLALELAATRLMSASPAEVLGALDDQLAVLRGGPGRGRHATMEQTIAWSFELLPDEERRVLSALSVFRSPFRLDAATRVVDAEHVAEHLHRLVRCSMLTPVRDPHGTLFRMLEPIRQFVEQQLDATSLPVLRARHAEYFAERVIALTRALHTSDEPLAAAALTSEWPDVVEAVRWGLDAGRPDIAMAPLVELGFHIRWQQRTEAYRWVEAGLDTLDLEPDMRKNALVVVALGAWTDGDLERLADLHTQAREIGDTGVRGAMLDLFAVFYTNDPTRLVARAEAFCEAADDDENPTWIEVAEAFRLTSRALANPDGEQTLQAAEALDRRSRRSQWPSGRSWRLISQLMWSARRGQAEAAARFADEISVEAAANGTPFFVQTAGPLLAGVQEGDVTQRLVGAADAVKLIAEAGEEVNYPLSFRSAAIALHAAGHLATAARITGFVATLGGAGNMIEVMTAEYDDVVADLRRSLGADEYAHLAGLGRRLTARAAAQLVAERSSTG